MSADGGGMSWQTCSARHEGEGRGRGCAPGEPWKAVEVLAMVLGFIVFWPIGLAVLGWKIWQRKSGYPGDIISFGREMRARWARGRPGFAPIYRNEFRGGWGSSGNAAFDEWRAAELARLEEEYQRVAAAERDFAQYLDTLRRARDREEFERFMNERRRRQQDTA